MSFNNIIDGWMKDPKFRKDYRAYKARMDLADAMTGWMRRIPIVGDFIRIFWASVLGEGWRSTIKPRWGAITFSFLNDGMKPTLWHTWRQVRYDQNDPYTGIYVSGAPVSLAQAQEWEAGWVAEREARKLSEDLATADEADTYQAAKAFFDEHPTNENYEAECGS